MSLTALARLLSPWSDLKQGREWFEALTGESDDWQQVHDQATTQWCTPLLYEVLQEGGCLDALPEAVRALLRRDCLENRLRNQLLKTELADLLRGFANVGIEVVLLKGAATFADNLYGSLGGRTMLDLDLLVRPSQLQAAIDLLVTHGYEEEVDPGKQPTGLPTDGRHAHINGYRKPGTPVLVELHYNIAYGQGGRILSTSEGWLQTFSIEVDGVRVFILKPTYRLLHNTVHGLISDRDYIRGEVRLWNILEFAWLGKRYWEEIDWQDWLGAAKKESSTTAFLGWLFLAHDLLAMPLPEGLHIGFWPRIQARRLMSATLLENWGRSAFRKKTGKIFSSLVVSLLHRGYYWLHLPSWVWRNVCYAEGWGNVLVRMRFFLSKLVNRRSWGKI